MRVIRPNPPGVVLRSCSFGSQWGAMIRSSSVEELWCPITVLMLIRTADGR